MFFQWSKEKQLTKMVMVSSAVLGAAAGTGLALLLAVTIVMYRYYLLRRRGKEWDELDRWEETRIMRKLQMKVGEWRRVSVLLSLLQAETRVPWCHKCQADTATSRHTSTGRNIVGWMRPKPKIKCWNYIRHLFYMSFSILCGNSDKKFIKIKTFSFTLSYCHSY